MKNLNEQIDRIKSVMGLINEQDRRTMRAAQGGFSCKGHPRSELRQCQKGGGNYSEEKTVSQWENFANSEIDKNTVKTVLENNKDILKTLDPKDSEIAVKAAIKNAETFNNLNPRNGKYFDEKGVLSPNLQPRDIGSSEFIFLKKYFPSKLTIEPNDILNLFSKQLGGIEKYKDAVNNYYKIQ